MLISIGKVIMLLVWAFLLSNIFHPTPKPLKYFIDIALIFMLIMHNLQLVLMKNTQPKDTAPLSGMEQLKLFIFGVFELLAWQKQTKSGE